LTFEEFLFWKKIWAGTGGGGGGGETFFSPEFSGGGRGWEGFAKKTGDPGRRGGAGKNRVGATKGGPWGIFFHSAREVEPGLAGKTFRFFSRCGSGGKTKLGTMWLGFRSAPGDLDPRSGKPPGGRAPPFSRGILGRGKKKVAKLFREGHPNAGLRPGGDWRGGPR